MQAREAGVLERVGQTEASVDLARLAGLKPAGVICEILREDGSMARRAELHALAQRFNIPFITVAQLIHHRLQTERTIQRVTNAELPTRYGKFEVIGYESAIDGSEHLAMIMGDLSGKDGRIPLVRMHSECLTGISSAACAAIAVSSSMGPWRRLPPMAAARWCI